MNYHRRRFRPSLTIATLASLTALPSLTLNAQQQPTEGTGPELTLGEAVRAALASHPSVGIARASLGNAEGVLTQAKAPRFPNLQATGSAFRFEEPMIVAPLHGFDPQLPPDFSRSIFRWDVTLSYQLFDGGLRGSRIRSARSRRSAADSELRNAGDRLITSVVGAYVAVLTAEGVLDAERETIRSLEAERARVNRLLREGAAPRVEVLRLDAALAQARADEVAFQTELHLRRADLARLTGRPDGPPVEVAPVRLSEDLPQVTRAVALEAARSQNPALDRARHQRDAAAASVRAARSDWFPRLDLVGIYQGFGGGEGELVGEWQAGVKLSYPILTGGSRSGSVRAAEARREEARERLELIELEIAERVDAALAAADRARARVAALSQAVRHQEEVVRVERLSLDAGAGVQTDYLRAEADLLDIRASLVAARNAEITARVELTRLMGGLSPETLERMVELDR